MKNPAKKRTAGRPSIYGTPKKTREVSVTDEGWQGAQALASSHGCTGVSDLLEKLGRGELAIAPNVSPPT